jgi:nucleotide-binding universal stress UspA family protein
MRLKTILWASDGSRESNDALRWAEVLATRFKAKLIGLNVIETMGLDALEVPQDLQKEISLIDSAVARRESRRLTRVRNLLERRGIQSEMRIVHGYPYREIINAARGVDLIAMGKRGLNAWGRMLLGSTTAKVLREAHVPVLTVRSARRRPQVKKILLPTSFHPMDAKCLEWALELAREFSAVLFLLHVMEVHRSYEGVRGGFVGRLRESSAGKMHAMLSSISTQKRRGATVVERTTAFPRAGSGIVRFASDQGIDTIVMSTQAGKKVSRFILGSVAESVVKESPCPVITITP